ncbi:MAG: methyl-accepting chemotaxis protein [Azoarcus sp.]|jgi:methyl-accepting chemotaxis protein|nr:methyl-accepting chemotaxis protein [Azoarcus sp.]
MLKPMKVMHKILLVAAVALTGMTAIALSGNAQLQSIVQILAEVYENQVVPLRDLKLVSDLYGDDVAEMSQKANGGLITLGAAYEGIQRAEAQIAKTWTKFLQTELTPAEKKLVDEIERLRVPAAETISKLKKILTANDMAALTEFTHKDLYPTINPLTSKFAELIQLQLDVAKANYEEGQVKKAQANIVNTMVVLIAVISCIALALFVARQINRELGGEPMDVARTVGSIANGNLDGRVDVRPGYENSILGSVERMRASLSDIISRIRANSEQFKEYANTLSDNGNTVMAAVNIQNESTSAIAAAVEQMSVNISQISDSATDASKNSRESSATVEHGIEVVQRSVQGMDDIMRATEITAESIKRLAEKSSEIGKIVGVIKGIADQTNLLALNAAIEAARAGEAGRGFAVVADEVRQLAERTAQSTNEIVTMVEATQTGTQDALKNTAAGQTQVAEGERLANDTGASMHEVRDKIGAALASVNTITDALSEQSAASQQIGRDIERIAQMTDDNAVSVNKLNDTATHVKELAMELHALVDHFKL